MEKIALALGGNQGSVGLAFARTAAELQLHGVTDLRFGKLVMSHPVGCPPGTPDFINSAIIGSWGGTAMELLKLCQQIEVDEGRPREHGVNQPRPLDIDLILFGGQIIDLPELKIPHPLAQSRMFVLEPLAAMAADWRFPDTGRTVAEAMAELRRQS